MWRSIGSDEFEIVPAGTRYETISVSAERERPLLPVAQSGNGDGPTVLVCGGTHGDEFEGQMVALELARSLDALAIDGHIVVVPLHHEAACRAGTRRSPSDGRDLNRAYGLGSAPDSSPTATLAAFVERRIIPFVDVVIDLHSGGEAFEFLISSNLQARVGSEEYAEMLPALLAFDAPYAIVFDEAGDKAMPHRGTLEGAARAMGKRAISSELGGGGRVTTTSLAVARQGLSNLLRHFGVVRSAGPRLNRESRSVLLALDEPDQHIAMPFDGWFVPALDLGSSVAPGDLLAFAVRDDAPFDPPASVRSPVGGVIAACAHRTRQRAGAAVVYVARPI